jgi:cysteine desulfurase / selenocysteine lyase
MESTLHRMTAIGGRSVAEIRTEFPILARTVGSGKRSHPLVYLDNAATTQKPTPVVEALSHYYYTTNANVHRALHRLGEEATEAFEIARGRVKSFINAASPKEIVFTRGTTESINLVARSYGSTVGEGDEIVLTEMEHHSNLIPWQFVAAERGAKLRFVPIRDDGSLDMEALEELLNERTKLVAVTHMSNVLATINDIRSISSLAHDHGVPVLVDGAQSVPHFPVDVQDLGCDFLAFSGHKMYAPMGIGVLYGKEALLDRMPPYMGGGEMISAVWLDRAQWNDLPYKFEAGTPNVEGAVGLGAAIEYLQALGMDNVAAYEGSLADYALKLLAEMPELELYGPTRDRGAVVSFNLGSVHAHDVAQFLDSRGIAVRAGHHCAHPLMRRLGIPATTRASFSAYNTYDEVEALRDALVGTKEFFAYGL